MEGLEGTRSEFCRLSFCIGGFWYPGLEGTKSGFSRFVNLYLEFWVSGIRGHKFGVLSFCHSALEVLGILYEHRDLKLNVFLRGQYPFRVT
jgi:hypothetical protein